MDRDRGRLLLALLLAGLLGFGAFLGGAGARAFERRTIL